jgi:hypothetical protein
LGGSLIQALPRARRPRKNHLSGGLQGPRSRALVRRRMAFLQRWRQHNVEEAGNLPYFLPELYTRDPGS